MRLYKRKARQNIWRKGFKTKANNRQGYTRDRSLPSPPNDHEANDTLLVAKGQEYWTWHPKGSDWQYSLKKPDLRSAWEIETSEFQTRVDEAKEDPDEDDVEEMLEELKDSIVSGLEDRISELQENLSNMPEQLQESSVLNERIEELQALLEQLN